VTAERWLVTGAPGCMGPWIVRSSARTSRWSRHGRESSAHAVDAAGHDAASQVPSRHGPGLTPDVAGVSEGSGWKGRACRWR